MNEYIKIRLNSRDLHEGFEFKLNVQDNYVRTVKPKYKMVQVRSHFFSRIHFDVLNNYGHTLFQLHEMGLNSGHYQVNGDGFTQYEVTISKNAVDIFYPESDTTVSFTMEKSFDLDPKGQKLLVAALFECLLADVLHSDKLASA